MKALSLYQPWAHLLSIGAKRYETRGWATKYRGPIAVHAAKRWTGRMAIQCYEEPFFTILSASGKRFPTLLSKRGVVLDLDFGAVIAVAELVDCRPTTDLLREIGHHEKAFGDFSHDRWAFEYANVRRLETPVPVTGRQGFFEVDDRVIAPLLERSL